MAQVLVQVVTSFKESLREKIINDAKLGEYGLKVVSKKNPRRVSGWAKLHSKNGGYGAINVQWFDDTAVLLCRVVTKGKGKPDLIIGNFIWYLLGRYPRVIESIHIIPR